MRPCQHAVPHLCRVVQSPRARHLSTTAFLVLPPTLLLALTDALLKFAGVVEQRYTSLISLKISVARTHCLQSICEDQSQPRSMSRMSGLNGARGVLEVAHRLPYPCSSHLSFVLVNSSFVLHVQSSPPRRRACGGYFFVHFQLSELEDSRSRYSRVAAREPLIPTLVSPARSSSFLSSSFFHADDCCFAPISLSMVVSRMLILVLCCCEVQGLSHAIKD